MNSALGSKKACYSSSSDILPSLDCLRELGVRIVDTRDNRGRYRILPLPPGILLNRSVNLTSYEIVSNMTDALEAGPLCCSPTAFAILNLTPSHFRMTHHLISVVHQGGTEIDYTRMSFREKLKRALDKANQGYRMPFVG